MIEHIFPPRMMYEREKQLVLSLLDCAGVYYDVNFTQNMILGAPVQIVDGKEYSILDQIGKPKNCSYTEIIEYWAEKMPPEERAAFVEFSDIDRIKASYLAGERLITHKFWTYDVLGNSMLAKQRIRLYEDVDSGDLLGLVYVSNDGKYDAMQKKESDLEEQYRLVFDRVSFFEAMADNMPGGYHRCGTDDGFPLEFVSDTFLKIVGWTKEEIVGELNNRFINIVAPEDRDYFMSHEPALVRDGRISAVYRIIRKDGSRRWVQDSTLHVEKDGMEYYQCVLSDITEHVENLNEAKARAEASNQAKSSFLFNASHDIRTPMNAIKGYAHILEENAENPAIVRETVEKINKASDILVTLMNDVLDLARIERGKEEINAVPVNLSGHGKNLYEMFASSMKSSGIDFRMESDIQHFDVLCDPLKFTRIGMNMLSNAKKFTPPGGEVVYGAKELSSNDSSATYRFYVRDTGIGMSKEFLKRAFDQFERERTSTESGVAGSGLGLAIIKKLVELMGGTVEIKSELGVGTEISATVTFDFADKIISENEKIHHVSADMTGKRVLLVEDNDFNREIARYILEGMNFEVDEAENGSVCVNKLMNSPEGHYDLVLMDIQMPIMDGYTAAMEIRNLENKKIAAVPIIAMTANAFDEDKEKCLAVGMDGHVGKPIDIEILQKEIDKLL